MQRANVAQFPPKVIPFTSGRDIAREVAEKVASLALAKRQGHAFSEEELSSVILVAIGTYRESVGR
jgi:hypothetical protein